MRGARYLTDPDYRAIAGLRRVRDGRVFQPYPTTQEDRYPEIFEAIAIRLQGVGRPRILCFGCASGEEVRALRKRMAQAEILGLDVNARAIARAIAADPAHAADYRVADRPPPGRQYDAILAMAVFRHGDLERLRPPSCAEIMPFRQFEYGVGLLDAALVPGGVLAIAHAQFRLADTELASRYEVELRAANDPPPQDLLYGPDDRLLAGISETAVLFRKRADAPGQKSFLPST